MRDFVNVTAVTTKRKGHLGSSFGKRTLSRVFVDGRSDGCFSSFRSFFLSCMAWIRKWWGSAMCVFCVWAVCFEGGQGSLDFFFKPMAKIRCSAFSFFLFFFLSFFYFFFSHLLGYVDNRHRCNARTMASSSPTSLICPLRKWRNQGYPKMVSFARELIPSSIHIH